MAAAQGGPRELKLENKTGLSPVKLPDPGPSEDVRSWLQSPKAAGGQNRRASTGGFSSMSWGDRAYQQKRKRLDSHQEAAAMASADHAAEMRNRLSRGESIGSEVESWGAAGTPGSFARAGNRPIPQRRASAFVVGSHNRVHIDLDIDVDVDPDTGRSMLLQSPPAPKNDILQRMFNLDNALEISRSRRSSLAGVSTQGEDREFALRKDFSDEDDGVLGPLQEEDEEEDEGE